MPGYYDIDAILAEEELIPCTTNFDFAHLGHLDPDQHLSGKQHLPEGSRIKLPLWALKKWSSLNYVNMGFPRHYQRKARERLAAAPSEVDLRKRNERYFLAGRFLVDMIQTNTPTLMKTTSSSGREKLERVAAEANKLRSTLLKTYTGERLRQTLDWSLSSVGDDVTIYTDQLTVMERRLFQCGAVAATAHLRWRVHGKRRWLLRSQPTTTSQSTTKRQTRPVSPDTEQESNKRQKQ